MITRNKSIIFLSLLTLLFTSCDEKDENVDCSSIFCDYVPTMCKVQFLDKTTGEDLFFEKKPSYSLDSLEIFAQGNLGKEFYVKLDSVEKVIRLESFHFIDSIKLAGFPADELDVSFTTDTRKCCSTVLITELIVNDSTICKPCNEPSSSIFTIKK